MNGNPHDQHEKQHETPDRRHEQSEPVEKTGTPDAVEAALVRRDDREHAPAGRRARGVEWVRPTDLIARNTASLAGRGIDMEVEMSRKAREPLVAGLRNLSDRARRLSPLTAFGHGARHHAPTRAAVGKS